MTAAKASTGALLAALLLIGSTFVQAQAPAAPAQQPPPGPAAERDNQRLPVRRVVLYKSGVGYFEHLGKVRGNQNVTIEFTSGQLNDVLKSLTTLDLGGGRVTNVNYNSTAALERRLAGLRIPLGQQATRGQLLSALRGTRVEVGGAATRVAGRLLSVERVERRRDASTSTTVDAVTLVTDGGDVQQIALDPGITVRIAEPGLNREVGQYLSLVASERDQDLRQLTLATTGAGERDLFVSYISEVPVWKATYRLVLPAAAEARRPLLQGWAIVDNTVGADWDNVELSLVAGAPQSFVQDISRPYYVQRPVVPLPERMSTTPQTHQGALTTLNESVGLQTQTAAGRGGGSGSGRGVGAPAPPAAPNRPPDYRNFDSFEAVDARVDAARMAMQSEATAAQMGDLFEYKLKERVTLKKNQSALVPILAGEVTADKVSVWNAASTGRPLRAVWVTNTTGLTLDGGTFSIVEGNAFAGEGLIEPLKAGERRLLSYALDLGVRVSTTAETKPTPVTKVTVARGVLIQTVESRQSRTYTARNEDAEPRTLVIEHPARVGWTLGGTVKPEESTAAWHRYRVTIPARSSATLTVEESQPVTSQVAISDVDTDRITVLVRDKAISPQLEAALREVLRRKTDLNRLTEQRHQLDLEDVRINADQIRLRENMKALKGTAEEKALLQRYVKQLDDQETRLEALGKEIKSLQGQIDKAQADLAAFISTIAG